MNLNVKDKVYIVTGGTSSIGEAVCKLIAEEGGIAVIVDKNEDKGKPLQDEITSHQQHAYAIPVELTDEDAMRQMIKNVVEKYDRIDGLVINAGTNDNTGLKTCSVQRFQRSLTINLVHYYTMAQYALPHLKKSKGAIINIGSKVSATGQGGSSRYAASKGGITALTREWAVELLPYSIRVNAVLSAEAETPQHTSRIQPQSHRQEKLQHIPFKRRFTTPEEIANAVVFLLSNASSHTTGQILFVDDGYTHLDKMLL